VKYLAGRINVTTNKSKFEVQTDTATYQINMRSDLEIQTSGIDDIEHYLDQRVSSLVFPGNNGFGIDLGAPYQINGQISVNASVLDVGFITWKKNTMTLASHTPGEQFAFNGLALKDFTDMIGNIGTFGRKITDSILDVIDIDTIYDKKYTTMLPVRYNAGGTYTFNDHHRVNLLLNGISWEHHFYPAMAVSYYYQLPRILGLMVSYNIYNNQFTNFGAGFSVNAGPVQLYAVTDNLRGMIAYRGSKSYSVQFGINIAINRKKEPMPVKTEQQDDPAAK